MLRFLLSVEDQDWETM